MTWSSVAGWGMGTRSRYLIIAVAAMLMITAAAPRCSAQTWAEWFSQKKTQKKYLLNQIAALQVYIGYAKKGYELVGSGLGAIRDMSNGEFSLHSAFITGLKKVNPAIRNDVRIAEILELQLSVLQSFKRIRRSEWLSADQLVYVAEVAEGLFADCYRDLEELLLVVTSGKLEMKDEERLRRIDGIYERMLDKAAVCQDFCAEAGVLIRQKEAESLTLDRLRRYYGIE